MKKLTQITTFLIFFFSSYSVIALPKDEPFMRCGDFTFASPANEDGWIRINGRKPETQKFTWLREPNDFNHLKISWMVKSDTPGVWLGMDYHRDNKRAWLNVQIVTAHYNAPRIIGSFPCRKPD